MGFKDQALVYQKASSKAALNVIVLVMIPTIQTMLLFPPISVITTTVNQTIQQTHTLEITCILMTHSGMASSVKVSVAAMESLLHGSVWSYQTQQLMILRCVVAVV